MVAEALVVVRDRAHPTRDRWRAAHLVADLTTTPPQEIVEFLRKDAADGGTSSRDRVNALFTLRWGDGLSAVRTVRDDERERPAVRRQAADLLINYSSADRVAAARVLLAIATDPAHRPALRHHAAVRLLQLGEAMRIPAREAMWVLARDEDASTALRAQALKSLVWFALADRRAVLGTAGELLATDNPLHRAQVLRAIGDADPTAAALELGRMMRDGATSPVARVRCAEFAVEFRRDRKDQAATVVRSIAFDDSLPAHVRKRAARCLARWSEACREEARDLLRRLVLPAP
ncbi:hypothetical protein [Saccharothrix syringae]|uniref:HEAT repeat domain-containing protein n=1 Tax=Saccharothrix syringae TaxID=103733 RepID=A0A5Q0H3Z5_SACSY|nr:hypothetical protein [Saccharothrix syringae]QFZ20442.1 hypothetical protein EKG83_26190 [Saccharothrix syringae]